MVVDIQRQNIQISWVSVRETVKFRGILRLSASSDDPIPLGKILTGEFKPKSAVGSGDQNISHAGILTFYLLTVRTTHPVPNIGNPAFPGCAFG